ncbi:DUF2490 domain-containing protein [Luteitalea sp. TBR-22]|uniref:DUF2490 domain-containing protein n=1 Tax=Luteitalea sp. TBR-22 TaxID=2802971 RepID=UPI001EF45B4C|nr:DUF2490 domain-containing protein [Luteitalea sp. TBR-22]
MAVCCVLATAAPAAVAQTNLQLWGNVTLDWARSERLVYELDFEPKVLLAAPEGEPGWRNLDVTPNVEYAAKRWLDLVAETTVGFTRQTDNVDSFELSPRVGLRFHVFSRRVPTTGGVFGVRELPPTRRIVVRDLVRFESRNFIYTGDTSEPNSFTTRFRNRLEFLVPLNKQEVTNDGARYLLADWEWFVPLGQPAERFANKQRIRTGLGFRRSFSWRLELLYMWTRSRDTVQEGFTTNDNSINVRLKRVF